MSSVPEHRREESKFEADHNFTELEKVVTDLIFRDFGVNEKRITKEIEKYRKNNKNNPNVDKLVSDYEIKYRKFLKQFIKNEAKTLLKILSKIRKHFAIANSIFPTPTDIGMNDLKQRRKHLNKAIGLCNELTKEIQYTITVLPVDLNRYIQYNKIITSQMNLYRGIKKSDNARFNKNENNKQQYNKK